MEIPEIEEYENWLKTLNEGEKVAVEFLSEGKKPDYDVRTILKIKEDIIEVHGMQPFKNGVINRYVDHFTRICPITQEALDIADRKRLIESLREFDPRRYSTETLREIYKIINELAESSKRIKELEK